MIANLMIVTPRLLLRAWRATDRQVFGAMNADPEVMQDLGGPISRDESDEKLDRYVAALEQDGLSRWLIEDREHKEFLGYAGLLHRPDHPIGAHFDLAWRLTRTSWGRGYATEAAAAALKDAFDRVGLAEALAYTSADNLRSRAVMVRLGLRRDQSRDFMVPDERLGEWHGLVWVARSS